MRRQIVAVLLALGTALVAAQYPTKAPVFEPGDTEGLVVSPNPRIRYAWKRKVFWKTESEPARGASRLVPVQTSAERGRMTATLDTLTTILAATPTGSAGEGFWVMDARTLDYANPYDLPERTALGRFPLVFETGLYPFYHQDVETNGKWRLSVKGETAGAYFIFNKLPGAFDAHPVLQEPRGTDRPPEAFYLRPRVTATWAGLPVYEGQGLVVARKGRDLWAAVTLDRALKAAVVLLDKDRATAETRLAGYKKTLADVMSPEWEQQKRETFEKDNGELRTSRPSNYATRQRSLENEIAVMRQKAQADANPPHDAKGAWYWNPVEAHAEVMRRLSALSAEDAAGPACYVELTGVQKEGRYSLGGSIVPARTTPGCREIVRTNWDYFDVSLPRWTPQILWVSDFGRCVKVDGAQLVSEPINRWDAPPQGCVQHARMWREADWAKIAALVVE